MVRLYNPLPFPGNGDQPKTSLLIIASKSKSRLVTPPFYGRNLKAMVGHASPLEDSPQIGIWIVQQDAAIHGQKASFIRIAW